MERRRQEGTDDRTSELGWCLGSDEFRQELLAAAQERIGANQHFHIRLRLFNEFIFSISSLTRLRNPCIDARIKNLEWICLVC